MPVRAPPPKREGLKDREGVARLELPRLLSIRAAAPPRFKPSNALRFPDGVRVCKDPAPSRSPTALSRGRSCGPVPVRPRYDSRDLAASVGVTRPNWLAVFWSR